MRLRHENENSVYFVSILLHKENKRFYPYSCAVFFSWSETSWILFHAVENKVNRGKERMNTDRVRVVLF